MKKTILSILLLGASLFALAQENEVLMTINGKPIMASEFLYIYEKNNQETSLENNAAALNLAVNVLRIVGQTDALYFSTAFDNH